MKIFRHYDNIPPACRGAAVALGNFDGVHRGHQAVIGAAQRVAEELGTPLGVIAFEPHPQQFFRPETPFFRLTSFRAKAQLLEEMGVDILYALPFDAALAGMLAQDFVKDVLVNSLGIVHIAVGYDFRFGQGRTGNTALLAYMGEMEGFGVSVVKPAKAADDEPYASSRIRDFLQNGKPQAAARLLGHWWRLAGHVSPGDRRGRELGFPTANLPLDETVRPAYGVYAVQATVEEGPYKGTYDGVASLGVRPMFKADAPLLEVHLFDFESDIYGAPITVTFVDYIRPEQNFGSPEDLTAQMIRDAEAARRCLAGARANRELAQEGLALPAPERAG